MCCLRKGARLALALAGLLVLACGPKSTSTPPYDLSFIDAMTVHHQAAVAMGRLAESRALHQELKDFAYGVVENQSREIDSMKVWRDRWFPDRPQSPGIMNMPGMAGSMKGMDSSMLEMLKGNEFDLMFIEMMVPHHQGAIVMAEDALTKAQHPQIRSLAQQIIDAQHREVQMMMGWKAAWAVPSMSK